MVRAAGSYPAGRKFESHRRYQQTAVSRFKRPLGQAVKTPPFHGGNMGSIPVGVTKESDKNARFYHFFSFFLAIFKNCPKIIPNKSLLFFFALHYFGVTFEMRQVKTIE